MAQETEYAPQQSSDVPQGKRLTAEELKARRQNLRISQSALAQALGVTANTVARWERNKLGMRTPSLIHLALSKLEAERRQSALSEHKEPPTQNYSGAGTVSRQGAPAVSLQPSHWPDHQTSFVGREQEVEDLAQRLHNAKLRILTLTGPGGVGKTRLALAVAERVRSEFCDGIRFVDLAPISDHKLVLRAIAGSLGLSDSGSQPIAELISHALKSSQLLLILDNFEQVIDAAMDVAKIVSACPQITVLATSREPLRLGHEQRFPVPPLRTPHPSDVADIDDLAQVPAVQLLVDRAKYVVPGFTLTHHNARSIADLCEQLDGVPLVIELAAARLGAFPPPLLVQQVSRQLDFTGARDAPPRHQSLRAAVQWSYDLLLPSEQQLFRNLCVFTGPFLIDAAVAVGGGGSIGTLVDRALVQPPSGNDQARHYRLLAAIRAFGAEQLSLSGDADQVHSRLAAYCLAVAESELPKGDRRHSPPWLDRMEEERDNLRVALRWALDSGRPELALQLAGAASDLWWVRGYLEEGETWLELALDRTSGTRGPLRARALAAASDLLWRRGKYEQAIVRRGEELAIRYELSDLSGIASALARLALMYHSRRNEQPARDYFNRARIVCAQLDDHTGIADALSSLGWLMAEYDELDAGIAILEEAVTLQRRLGGGVGLSRALGNLTFLLGARKGNWSRAQPLLEESYALSASVADAWSIAHGFVLLARAAGAVGKPYVAAQLLGAGQHLLSRIQADWYPSVGQDFRDSLDQAQAALGQERFAAAFREGGQLPTAEAFGLGLGMIREAAMRERRHVGPQLTKREGEVADRVAGGRTNGEIARELVVSERTVEKHMSAILTKLNFRSRAQVAAWITARSNSTTTSSPTGAETGPRSRQRKSGSSSG